MTRQTQLEPRPKGSYADSGLAAAPADLAKLSTGDLRAELARGLTLTASALTHISLVWAELERRGEDLEDLRHGIALYLPAIASGQLASEAVVAFAARRSLLRVLSGVPLAEQRRLAAGGTVAVIDPTRPDVVIDTPLSTLPSQALPLVFDGGTIRPPELQRIALRSRQPRRRQDAREIRYRPHFDRATGTLQVGRMSVRLDDLLAELAAAAGPDKPPPSDMPGEVLTVKARLSKEEYERFQALCRRHGLPDWEMLRKAMRAFALI